jgi:DNA-binding response OmpR family regulator
LADKPTISCQIKQILLAIIFYLHSIGYASKIAEVNQKAKILIVEDETSVAIMMKFLLARADCETIVAETGKKALQKAQIEMFDLIVLDVDLPGMSGFEVCRRLKENPFFQTPIVFVSGRTLEQDIQRGLEHGAVDYIAKPFETFEFAPRLLSHVKAQQMLAKT